MMSNTKIPGLKTKFEDSPDNWDCVLENLTAFLSASADLVKDLKQTVQRTEAEFTEDTESSNQPKDPKKTVQKAEEEFNKNIGSSSSEMKLNKKDTCICSSPPCNFSKKADGDVIDESAKKEAGTLPASTAKEKQFEVGDQKSKNISFDAKNSVSLKEEIRSTETIVLEPQYEVFKEDFISDAKDTKSQQELKKKGTTSSTTKTQSIGKQLSDKYTKEKAEKLTKLKGSVATAQRNISEIQEQLRQLERLFQDYTSLNTSDGHVNPAALYKEIMKPQPVPYVKQTSTSQISLKNPCTYEPCHDLSASSKLSFKENQQITKKNQEKVFVLSAVPLDRVYN